MRSRRDNSHFLKIIGQVLLVLVLLFFGSVLVQGLSSPTLYLTYPLFRATNQLETNLKNVGEFLTSQKRLLSQIGTLRQQTATLTEQNQVLTAQVQNLSELAGILATSTKNLLPLRVLTRPSQSPYDTLVVDLSNARASVPAGSLVFSAGGVVLGKIDEVTGIIGRAVLFSSPGQQLAVQVGSEHVAATAVGLGGGNFKIVLPRGVEVKTGDPVMAPAVSTDLLGVVGTINASPADPFQTIYFKSPVNLYELVWVFAKI